MALFWKYLRQQKKVILVQLLFSVIFAVVFWLYRLPLEAVLYPCLLCLMIGILLILADYGKARQKHARLERISRLESAMIDDLPDAKRLDDEDYQAVIRAQQAEVRAIDTTLRARYQDMVEYYTMWVHQIKTPIASMRLHLQNEDTPTSRKLQSDLFRIEQYVEMVLAFLRLDSASTDYVFREHALDAVIRQAVKRFAHEFIDRKIRLEYEPIDRKLVTDDKWLSFVLEQVISNALKYTREGCVRIYMQGPDVLCIEDTGIGIAPEDLPRIFENGYTGYNGRVDKKASGIGLYLCRRICGNLGIGILAKSELGKGTVIELDLEQYQLRKE
ncbi:MAG: sensor histidine kinase [Agathobacter sp.]|nr:sensor histidine kinase [Agathobacter sp.]